MKHSPLSKKKYLKGRFIMPIVHFNSKAVYLLIKNRKRERCMKLLYKKINDISYDLDFNGRIL